GAAIVLGGYFQPEFSPRTPFQVTPALNRAYDLVATVRAHPPPLLVWLETSHSDPVSYPSSKAFLAAARAPLSVHALLLAHAGHRMSLWDGELPAALDWLGASDPAFA